MPIISMNLMETLLQNEYTKCNESIPYKTFDHYTVRDSTVFQLYATTNAENPVKSFFANEIAYGIKSAENVLVDLFMLQRNISQTSQEK